MNWQEYQKAVAELYAQAEGIGIVRRDKTLPDRLTGQPRQIDCWIEAEVKGHELRILVDAKYHKNKIDTNHIDGVFALAQSVGVDKAIIVCPNGWTGPAEIKAKSLRMDLRLWTAEEAAGFMNPDFWMFCPVCNSGLIIMDKNGYTVSRNGIITWWLAGQCNECRGGIAWCQDCGEQLAAPYSKTQWCSCGHMWRFGKKGLSVYLKNKKG